MPPPPLHTKSDMKGGLLQHLYVVSRTEGSLERAQHTRASDQANLFTSSETPRTIPATAESSPEQYTMVKSHPRAGSPTLEANRRHTTSYLTELQKKLNKYSQSTQASRQDGSVTEEGWIDV